MHISTKGQVTIPQAFREELGLFPNTEVLFNLDKDRLYIVKTEQPSKRGKALIAAMSGKGDIKMTTDEIMALMRGD